MYVQEKTIKNIICDILKRKDLKIEFTCKTNSSIYLTHYTDSNEIIQRSEIDRFVISIRTETGETIFPYMTPTMTGVFKQYNFKLFSILHEVGHYKTFKGISYTAMTKKRDALYARVNSEGAHAEIHRLYRQTTPERRADKWAMNWILKHPKKAREYSNQLNRATY